MSIKKTKHLIEVKRNYGHIYCSKQVLRLLRSEFSILRKGAYFAHPDYRRIYFISPKGRFLSGLFEKICQFLTENNIEYETIDKRPKIKLNKEDVLERLDEFKLSLREEYQIPGLLLALKNPFCAFSWPTASGKGVFISSLIASFGLRTLVLIHTKELMYQLAENISSHLGMKVGLIGDGRSSIEKINVGIVASLTNNKYRKYLHGIEHLICDEYHHEAAKTWRKVVLSCKNVFIKNGFSATPFRQDNKSLYLEGLTGPIIQDISTSQMIEWGFLSRPHIEIVNIEHNIEDNISWQTAYRLGIVDSYKRNSIAANWCVKKYKRDKLIIVFVERVNHGKRFKNILLEKGVNYRDVDFVSGSESTSWRKKTLENFRLGKIRILIGTKIFNEGIDLPSTNAGVNLAGGMGDISTIQRLGRLLRKSKMDGIDVDRSEEIVDYLDFNDIGNKYLRKHSRSRIKVYEREKKFKIKKIS